MAGRAMLVHVERTHLLNSHACSSVDTTAGLRGGRRTAVPCCARPLTPIRPDSARFGR
ncbi:hypothethical protein (plasmid) [Ralstonia solanacearum PSI07]|nr:hypothethical protein [Ralstonia solanacearum PSI07]